MQELMRVMTWNSVLPSLQIVIARSFITPTRCFAMRYTFSTQVYSYLVEMWRTERLLRWFRWTPHLPATLLPVRTVPVQGWQLHQPILPMRCPPRLPWWVRWRPYSLRCVELPYAFFAHFYSSLCTVRILWGFSECQTKKQSKDLGENSILDLFLQSFLEFLRSL